MTCPYCAGTDLETEYGPAPVSTVAVTSLSGPATHGCRECGHRWGECDGETWPITDADPELVSELLHDLRREASR